MPEWYSIVDGEQLGPMSEEDLRDMAVQGRLNPVDLVWHEGMGQEWKPAETVLDAFGLPGAVPSPGGYDRTVPPLPSVGEGGVPSCTAAVGPAWQRMKQILFQPFNMVKWLGLGFTAWLATLGQGGGGGSGSANQSGRLPSGGGDSLELPDLGPIMEQAREFLQEHGTTIALVTVLVVLAVVGLTALLAWLRSRGTFMFLDNVAHNRAEIAAPWTEFKQHGNSLFVWRLVYALIWIALALLLTALTVAIMVLPWFRAGRLFMPGAGALTSVIMLWFVFWALGTLIQRYLIDFVVPIMYMRDLPVTAAWSVFLEFFRARKGALIVYALFYLVLSIAAGLAVFAAVLATCCTAGCLLLLPYIRAVALLPVTVFFRCYSLVYLAQLGPEHDLFRVAAARAAGQQWPA